MKNAIKRIVDILVCVGLTPFIVPIVGVCAVLIKLDSPGPVFFLQKRLGRNRRPFSIVKLRTMVPNAEHMGAGLFAVPNDPRYTRTGPTLRRLSLDELPQFYNVLKGDMSLVGPRPLPAVVIDQYKEEFDTILTVRPGITGLSQVNGRNALRRRERLKLDMYYATRWNPWLDLKILFQTVVIVFTGAGQLNYQAPEEVEDVQ